MKYLVVLLVFFLYCAACVWYYLCPELGVWCLDGVQSAKAAPVEEKITDPFLFKWKNIVPEQTSLFDSYKQKIMASNSPDSILQITGFYMDQEGNPSDSATLGFARAAMLRKLFPGIPAERIAIFSRKVNPAINDTLTSFVTGELKWIAKPQEAIAAVAEAAEVAADTGKLVSMEDRELFFFPYNSSKRLENKDLEAKLAKLGDFIKTNDDIIRVTGHTDNKGEPEYNMTLSKKRAEDVLALLLQLGVPKARIELVAKGLTEPRTTNATEEGRKENRRVEIELIKPDGSSDKLVQ